MKIVEQLKQHSSIIASFIAGATSAVAAGYIYCRIVHRRGCSPAPVISTEPIQQ